MATARAGGARCVSFSLSRPAVTNSRLEISAEFIDEGEDLCISTEREGESDEVESDVLSGRIHFGHDVSLTTV